MLTLALLSTLTLGALNPSTMANPIAQKITPNLNVPDGYQVGFATQDQEPHNQQSACTINGGVCSAPTPLYPTTAGPDRLPDGVYAAAVVGMGPDDCSVCGTCYSIMSSGTPYCDPNAASSCNPETPSGNVEQDGPAQIKVLITNHCPDCSMANATGQARGHFDINNMTAGWSNPRVYYMQIGDGECL